VDGKKFVRKDAKPTSFCQCNPPPKRKILGEIQINSQPKRPFNEHSYSCEISKVSKGGRPAFVHMEECIVNKAPARVADLTESTLSYTVTGMPKPLPTVTSVTETIPGVSL